MDWITFISIVAIPAFGVAIAATIWCYRDNRSTIRFNENRFYETCQRHEKEMADLRLQVQQAQHQLMVGIMEKYATKEELREMKGEILAAIGDVRRTIIKHEEASR